MGDVDWLLGCVPRAAQLEALARSYLCESRQDTRTSPVVVRHLASGAPVRGWGHFLQMRLGKTPVALNEFLLLQRDHGVKKLVVLAPPSYKEDWALEARKFGLVIPFHVYESSKAAKARKFVDENLDGFGLSINYEALNTVEGKKLLEQTIDSQTLLVADESIKIKNHDSIYTKTAISLAKQAGYVRALTGKPIVLGPQDMYSQLKFCGALEGWNYFQFRNVFCKMGGFKNKKVVGIKDEARWHELMNAHSWHTKRRDWGAETVTDYMTVKLEMAAVQQLHYDQMEKDFVTWLTDNDAVSADQIITQNMKLQQATSGFMIDSEQKVHRLLPVKEIPKVMRIHEMLQDEINGKVIIPFYYGASGDILLEALEQYKPAVIRGQQWMHSHQLSAVDEKKRFNETNCRVMIAQSTAVKYGHTLIGNINDRCEHIIFYENNYNLDDRSQVEQRNQAVDQDWGHTVVDFVSSKAEAGVIKALQQKDSLSEAVMALYKAEPTIDS